MDNIKFTYLKDFKDHSRVLTLARKIISKSDKGDLVIHVGWSLNKRPNLNIIRSLHTLDFGNQIATYKRDFDNYNKKEGKKYALERLEDDPFVVIVNSGEKPYDKVLEALSRHEVYYVALIADQNYTYRLATNYLKTGQIVQGSSDFVVFDTETNSSK